MASPSCQSYYEILGITQQAQKKEIRDAYHKLALKCHPDKDPSNPQAVQTFQKLSAAYDTLFDENRRAKYDAMISSGHSAHHQRQPTSWPPQTPFGPSYAAHIWQESMRRKAWYRSSRAREMADQARREDSEYWSGPIYVNGATDRSGSGEQEDRVQKDLNELYERRQQQRAARKEARRQAEKVKHDVGISPSQHPFDQCREQPEEYKEGKEDAWEKAADGSDEMEKEYQKRVKRLQKEKANRRKAEKEQNEKNWPAELLFLLSKIIDIQVDIENMGDKVDESRSATKDELKDEDHEQIFKLSIKRRSLKRRLKECIATYKRMVRMLRDWGLDQEASEADNKLREARKQAAEKKLAGHKNSAQGEQARLATEKQSRGKAKIDPLANNEGCLPNREFWSQSAGPYGGEHSHVEQNPRTMIHVYDVQYDGGTTMQQRQAPGGYVANPRVSYDDSDPDQGFTEESAEPSDAGQDGIDDQLDYDAPFYNDFHDAHIEVHREFWDIIDSRHECHFCHNICTVMRCPICDVQACSRCKDAHS